MSQGNSKTTGVCKRRVGKGRKCEQCVIYRMIPISGIYSMYNG